MRQHNLKSSLDKIQLKIKQFRALELHLHHNGHKPEDGKTEAISNMQQPTNVRDFQCVMVMIIYLNKYSSRLAELDDILR